MILSHSGWRGVFAASGDEEDGTDKIGAAHRIIAAGAAAVFAEYLRGQGGRGESPLVLAGCDTRPTGRAIAGAMIPVLRAGGCRVRYAGAVAAPEIMAWARLSGPEKAAFAYISASHNPVGHNGLKFGLCDGGVLPAEETGKLTAGLRSLLASGEGVARLEKLLAEADAAAGDPALLPEAVAGAKRDALKAYFEFSGEVAWGGPAGGEGIAGILRQNLEKRPLGICCDFNGSARCVSIDSSFFESLGIQFKAINARPGEIAHRIIPEGSSLDPCRRFLEELHSADEAFVLGYVPDCDGDRGNLVIWDSARQKARALEAQEVFALACVAELSYLVWTGALSPGINGRAAVAVNDPTSLRIDRIAGFFGVPVFRAEVGEANVVGLARRLREKGYTVRILGEGSNGGNITHPSAVRDPLHTALALVKLLSLRTEAGRPGLFEIWCGVSGQKGLYRPDYSLADILASLPPFATTGADTPEAALKIACPDHSLLKNRYGEIFLREWEERKDQLKTRNGIYGWEAAAYNGIDERRGIGAFGDAGRGGLKVYFQNAAGKDIASIWMRGSATEPVFRVIADAEGPDGQLERELIEWQRCMTTEADRS